MALTITRLHPTFGGEAGPIDLREVSEAGDLGDIRAAMDDYAVLVFRGQHFENDQLIEFAKRLDGPLNTKTLTSLMKKNRAPNDNDAIANISNLDAKGNLLDAGDRRRLFSLADRMWHADATFNDPPGRYSMLYARIVPPSSGDTEFADMRTAYDALSDESKTALEGLEVHHSIVHSRQMLGFEMSEAERDVLKGATHPLVRSFPQTGRKSLYLASHASMIVGRPVPEGRMLLNELIEHATRPEFVFAHKWRVGDLVIWDNRTTMHRATSFDDKVHMRDMRRITTLDVEKGSEAAA